ncbi:hypothetical protein BASA81_000199 [Batrachochytrium salamandrivorans]|nr:hypothetical protein BASA81_000199 [Batrachochytrium salamandrivorans]
MNTNRRSKRQRMCKKPVVEEEEEEEQALSGKIKLPKHPGKPAIAPQTVSASPTSEPDKDAICVICQCDFVVEEGEEKEEIAAVNCCGTLFHQGCLANYLLQAKHECCVCKTIFGSGLVGECPKGEMTWSTDLTQTLPGFPAQSGTITITYDIPGGKQDAGVHTNPGCSFSGTSRYAYLPNTKDGREVLELLKMAFQARLTFTIGTSLTTGQSDTVIWNGIHHKTTTHGGSFGYPDNTYLDRVRDELKQKGVVLN